MRGETPMCLRIAIVGLTLLFAVPVAAQDRPSSTPQLGQRHTADKRLLVAENMWLTESEAKAFWPIYDGYQEELDRIYSRIAHAISEYVRAYLDNTLTDEQARALTAEALDIDEAEAALAKTYAAKLDAVLPGKKVARYLQIERKIRANFRYQLADKIPLVK
jgi:hypothetical protein